MTAIFFGTGTGLERNNAWYLGSRAQMGDPALGRAADQVRVNATDGNLVIQNNDEILIGRGPDAAIGRTYNSRGTYGFNGTADADNWWSNTQRKIDVTQKAAAEEGGKLNVTDWDGSVVEFSFVKGQGRYLADGRHPYSDDFITFSGNVFTWTDGKTGTVQRFQYFTTQRTARLISVQDTEAGAAADRNVVSYVYDSTAVTGRLSEIVTQNHTTGQTNKVTFTYVGTTRNVATMITSYSDVSGTTPVNRTLTRTRYTYENTTATARLTGVSVDLSPEDNSITDGKTYTTNYTYIGTTKRIGTITQQDGSSLSIAYDANGRVTQLEQIADTGITRTTLFTYNGDGRMTSYTDALGNQTTMEYDAVGRVQRVVEPAAVSGGLQRITTIAYDTLNAAASSTLAAVAFSSDIRVFDGAANEAAGIYLTREYRQMDVKANVIEQGSIIAGNASGGEQATIIRRTFNTNNDVVRETAYTGVDGDGPGLTAPTGALTNRYVYDTERHLRYMISAAGRVTEYVYNAPGQLTSTIDYSDALYAVASLAENAALTETQLNTWRNAITDKSGVERTDTAYDFRGNITSVTGYSKALATGLGDAAAPLSRTYFIYDQYGKLLKRQVEGANQSELFVYDGLGRVISSTDLNGTVSTISINDGARLTTITTPTAATQTTQYTQAGELSATTVSGTDFGSATSTYKYDRLGRLRVVTDATGSKSFMLYDRENRKVADIDQDGSVIEYRYDAANRLIATIAHATTLTAAQVTELSDTTIDLQFASLGLNSAAADNRWVWNIYDHSGRLVQSIDATGAVVGFEYDGASRLIGRTAYATRISVAGFSATLPTAVQAVASDAANDRVERNFYDLDGLLVATLDAEGALTEMSYDAAGRKTRSLMYDTLVPAGQRNAADLAGVKAGLSTTADDIASHYYYDGRGWLIATVDGEGQVTRFTYTARGDLASEQRGEKVTGGVTRPSLATATGPQILLTTYTRRATGQVSTSASFANGVQTASTSYSYDSLGRLIGETTTDTLLSQARTTVNRYDERGRLIATVGGRGSELIAANPANEASIIEAYGTRFVYDLADRLIARIDPAANKTVFYYDTDGNLRFEINAKGEVVEHRYTVFDQEAATIVFGGRLTPAELASLSGGLQTNDVVATVAALEARTTGSNSLSSMVYNIRGELERATDAADFDSTFNYTTFGQLLSETRPSDETAGANDISSYSYDRRGLKIGQLRLLNGSVTGQHDTGYGYDAFGRLTSMRTAVDGRAFAYKYDRNSRMVESTDRVGVTEYFTYDALGNQFRHIDRAGNTTEFTYNFAARTVTTKSAENIQTVVTKNAWGQSISISDGESRTTTYDYDKSGNLIRVADAAGDTETAYDSANRVLDVTDGRGVRTHYEYDVLGRVMTRTENADAILEAPAVTTRFEYDAKGQQVDIVDGLGVVTKIDYDLRGQRVSMIQDLGGLNIETRYLIGPGGKIKAQIDAYNTAEQRRTGFEYDSMGRLVRTIEDEGTDRLNIVTNFTFDVNDNLIATSDNLGRVTRFIYDRENRQRFVINAEGEITETGYDGEGRVIWSHAYATRVAIPSLGSPAETISDTAFAATLTTSAEDRISKSAYDRDGRMVYAVDAEGYVTSNTYDKSNNVKTTTRHAAAINVGKGATRAAIANLVQSSATNDVVTSYEYDGANRLTDITDPVGAVTHFDMDELGQIRKTTVAYNPADRKDEAITVRVFDALGRVVRETRAAETNDAATMAYAYDKLGRVTGMTDALGATTVSTYDAVGRMLSQTVPLNDTQSATTSYQYDTRGNRVKVTDPRNHVGYFYYDGTDRLVLQVDAEGYATRTTYLIGDAISSVTRYFTPLAAGSYNEAAQPELVTSPRDATTQFGRDRLDRVVQTIDAENASEFYTLNAFGDRITFTNKLAGVTRYEYDLRGLVTEERVDAFDNSAGYIKNSYEYDSRGNLLKMTEAPDLAEVRATSYTYDKLDRLKTKTGAAIQGANTLPIEFYDYDLRGNLIRSADSTGAKVYAYFDDHNRKIAEISPVGTLTTMEYDLNGNLQVQRVYETALPIPTQLGGLVPVGSGGFRETQFDYDENNRLTHSRVMNVTVGRIVNGVYVNERQAAIESLKKYDAGGNLILETDANGGQIFRYYDKLGREIAKVDQLKFLTTWVRDSEGNVEEEIRYAKALVNTPTTEIVPAGQLDPDDRRTTFSYDKMGRRTKLVRWNLRDVMNAATGELTQITNSEISYEYNALGEVTKKREANKEQINDMLGDLTDYVYDQFGRLLRQTDQGFIDHEGVNVRKITEYRYDALNNVTRTEERANGAAELSGRVTTYSYFNGRLSSVQDAENFVRNYAYDLAGRLTREDWVRKNSEGAALAPEADVTVYDLAGRQTSLYKARFVDGQWTQDSVASELEYNSFGEVTARRMRGVGQGTSAPELEQQTQEIFEYDNGGRLVRTTSGDGVWKVLVYDRNGNATLTISSNGRDLSNVSAETLLDELGTVVNMSATNITATIAVYDARNMAIASIEPNRTVAVQSQQQQTNTQNLIVNGSFEQFNSALGQSRSGGWDFNGSIPGWVSANGAEIQLRTNGFEGVNATDGFYWVDLDDDDKNLDLRQTISGLSAGEQLKLSFDHANRTSLLSGAFEVLWNGVVIATVYHAEDSMIGKEYSVTAIAGDNVLGFRGLGSTNGDGASIDNVSLTRIQAPFGSGTEQRTLTRSQSYNAFGEVASETSARGNASGELAAWTTYYHYNTMGRMVRKVSPRIQVTDEHGAKTNINPVEFYYYDAAGRMVGSRDANGNLNRRELLAGTGHEGEEAIVLREYRADGSVWNNGYDVYRDMRSAIDGLATNGGVVRETLYTYDKLGRLTQIVRPSRTLTEGFTYDGLGQRVGRWNSVQSTPIYGPPVQVGFDPKTGPIYDTPVIGYNPIFERTDYDIEGRVSSVRSIAGDQTTTSYVWDTSITNSGLDKKGGNVLRGGWTKTISYIGGLTSIEKTDAFGHLVERKDQGNHYSSMTYNRAGQLAQQNGTTTGSQVSYTYDNSGRLVRIEQLLRSDVSEVVDPETGNTESYSRADVTEVGLYTYDADGNRLSERYESQTAFYEGLRDLQTLAIVWTFTGNGTPTIRQDARAEFDALNRMTKLTDSGASGNGAVTVVNQYDANGNVRRTKSVYKTFGSTGNLTANDATQDYWYRYDALNRFVTVKGVLIGEEGSTSAYISRGFGEGRDIEYDYAGQRTASISEGVTFPFGIPDEKFLQRAGEGGYIGATFTAYAEQVNRQGAPTYLGSAYDTGSTIFMASNFLVESGSDQIGGLEVNASAGIYDVRFSAYRFTSSTGSPYYVSEIYVTDPLSTQFDGFTIPPGVNVNTAVEDPARGGIWMREIFDLNDGVYDVVFFSPTGVAGFQPFVDAQGRGFWYQATDGVTEYLYRGDTSAIAGHGGMALPTSYPTTVAGVGQWRQVTAPGAANAHVEFVPETGNGWPAPFADAQGRGYWYATYDGLDAYLWVGDTSPTLSHQGLVVPTNIPARDEALQGWWRYGVINPTDENSDVFVKFVPDSQGGGGGTSSGVFVDLLNMTYFLASDGLTPFYVNGNLSPTGSNIEYVGKVIPTARGIYDPASDGVWTDTQVDLGDPIGIVPILLYTPGNPGGGITSSGVYQSNFSATRFRDATNSLDYYVFGNQGPSGANAEYSGKTFPTTFNVYDPAAEGTWVFGTLVDGASSQFAIIFVPGQGAQQPYADGQGRGWWYTAADGFTQYLFRGDTALVASHNGRSLPATYPSVDAALGGSWSTVIDVVSEFITLSHIEFTPGPVVNYPYYDQGDGGTYYRNGAGSVYLVQGDSSGGITYFSNLTPPTTLPAFDEQFQSTWKAGPGNVPSLVLGDTSVLNTYPKLDPNGLGTYFVGANAFERRRIFLVVGVFNPNPDSIYTGMEIPTSFPQTTEDGTWTDDVNGLRFTPAGNGGFTPYADTQGRGFWYRAADGVTQYLYRGDTAAVGPHNGLTLPASFPTTVAGVGEWRRSPDPVSGALFIEFVPGSGGAQSSGLYLENFGITRFYAANGTTDYYIYGDQSPTGLNVEYGGKVVPTLLNQYDPVSGGVWYYDTFDLFGDGFITLLMFEGDPTGNVFQPYADSQGRGFWYRAADGVSQYLYRGDTVAVGAHNGLILPATFPSAVPGQGVWQRSVDPVSGNLFTEFVPGTGFTPFQDAQGRGYWYLAADGVTEYLWLGDGAENPAHNGLTLPTSFPTRDEALAGTWEAVTDDYGEYGENSVTYIQFRPDPSYPFYDYGAGGTRYRDAQGNTWLVVGDTSGSTGAYAGFPPPATIPSYQGTIGTWRNDGPLGTRLVLGQRSYLDSAAGGTRYRNAAGVDYLVVGDLSGGTLVFTVLTPPESFPGWYADDERNLGTWYNDGPLGVRLVLGDTYAEPTFVTRNIERYTYNLDGYLTDVHKLTQTVRRAFGVETPIGELSAAQLVSRSTYDALGRVTGLVEYDEDGGFVYERYDVKYDLRSLVLAEKTKLRQRVDNNYAYTYTHTVNSYTARGDGNGPIAGEPMTADAVGVSSGSTLHFTYTKQWYDSDNDFSPAARDDRDFDLADIYTTYSYEYWDGAQQKNISLSNRDGTSVSSYTYDKLGRISSVNVGGPRAHTVNYTVDAAGQVISRYVTGGPNGQSPKQYYSYFNGIQIGSNGNNGNDNPDIATAIAEKAAQGPETPGIFRNGATSGSAYANFDRSYDPINAGDPEGSSSVYTVQGGESLQSIAAAIWGDTSMWYMIAQANGLNAGSQLSAGQMLVIPNKVANARNASDTFRPYDLNRALGDTQPQVPKPVTDKNKNCGFIGVILRAIVKAIITVAVDIVLGPIGRIPILGTALRKAVISAASQGWNKALGLQDRVDWKQVGIAAVSGAVDGVIGTGKNISNPFAKVAHAVVHNALTQGISKVAGLQKKFSWGQVAAAGASAAVEAFLGPVIGEGKPGLGEVVAKVVKGAARYVAATAAQSLVDGTNFGDNLLGGMADLIEGTIGDELAGAFYDDLPADLRDRAVGEERSLFFGPPKPEAGKKGTPNAVRNDAVKEGQENAETAEEAGEIVVTAQSRRSTLYSDAAPLFTLPGGTSGTGYELAMGSAMPALMYTAVPVAVGDADTFIGRDGKLQKYAKLGEGIPWKEAFKGYSDEALEATIQSVIKDRGAAGLEDFANQIRKEFLTDDGKGNLVLTDDNALLQYELSSRLRNLELAANPAAVKLGQALDPGEKVGRRVATNEFNRKAEALKKAASDPVETAKAVFDSTVETVKSVIEFHDKAQRAGDWGATQEERDKALEEVAADVKPMSDAARFAAMLTVDATNGSGFAKGMIGIKGAMAIAELLVLRGVGKLVSRAAKFEMPKIFPQFGPISSFKLPDDWKFGSGLSGDYAHDEIGKYLAQGYEKAGILDVIIRTKPGQTGVDVEIPTQFVKQLGYRYVEIKPNSPSGETTYKRQVNKWGFDPKETRSITYDANGNFRWGFDY